LSEECFEFLTQAYKALRQKGEEEEYNSTKKLPITVRSLETLIRLGTAHARLRLSNEVTTEDLQEALKLMNFAIFDEDDDEEGGEQDVDYIKRDDAEEGKY
jgi:DNA replication licensing factor MCM3